MPLPAEQTEEQIPPTPAPDKHDPYAAFRSPAYRVFILSFVFSIMAMQIESATLQWAVYQKTSDPLSLAWIGLVQALPILVLALAAGHMADSFPRKRVILLMQLIVLAGMSTLAVLSAMQKLTPGVIYIVLLINATAATFSRPARASLLPALVPLKHFPNAVTWNSTTFETLAAVGPFLAGVVIAFFNITAALFTAAAMLAISLVFVAYLPDHRAASKREPPSLESLLAGVKFVFRTRMMLGVMTLDLFAVLLGGATFLLPIFAERLDVGAVGYGWLRAAPAIGAVSMALLLAHMPPMKRAGRAILLAVAGFGVATIVFGLSRNIYLSFAMLLLCGMFDNISVIIRHTLVQTLTPDSMRGRVSSVNQIFIGSSNELGGVESGLTARWFGPVISVVSGGVGTLVVTGLIALRFPMLRKLGRLSDVKPVE